MDTPGHVQILTLTLTLAVCHASFVYTYAAGRVYIVTML